MKFIRIAITHLKEYGTCLKLGATLADKLKLMAATLFFHLNKRDGMKGEIIEVNVLIGQIRVPLRLRNSGGDMFIFHEVLGHHVYDVDPAHVKTQPKVIVDLGGNVGLASLALAAQFPSARIIAVEPHPENASLLRHNLKCLGQRVSIWEAAVSNSPGVMRLTLCNENYNASLVRSGPNGVDVRTVTMAEILQTEGVERIDVMKIDIEGAEESVLKGSPEWLKKVDVLLMEVHEGYTFEKVRADLEPAGLRVETEGDATVAAWRY